MPLIRLTEKTDSKFDSIEKKIKEINPQLQEMRMSKNYMVNFLIEFFLNNQVLEDVKYISFFNKGDKK